MTNALTVNGIVPGELYGASIPSTADLQSKLASKIAEYKAVREERAQERQIAKDARMYDKIRAQLVEKVFNYSPKEIERFVRNLEKFQEDSGEILTDKDKLRDIVNIANGARGTESGASRAFRWLLVDGASSLIGAGLTVTIGKSINEVMTAATMAMFAGIGASGALILVTATQALLKIAYNWYYKRKASSGNRSDTRDK